MKTYHCNCEKYCQGGRDVSRSTFSRHKKYRVIFSPRFQEFLSRHPIVVPKPGPRGRLTNTGPFPQYNRTAQVEGFVGRDAVESSISTDGFSPGILDGPSLDYLDDSPLDHLGEHTSGQLDTVQHRQPSDHADSDPCASVSDSFNAGIQPGDIEAPEKAGPAAPQEGLPGHSTPRPRTGAVSTREAQLATSIATSTLDRNVLEAYKQREKAESAENSDSQEAASSP